jgi:hypothetical protein
MSSFFQKTFAFTETDCYCKTQCYTMGMGAGKGKARRARMMPSEAPSKNKAITYKQGRWFEFLESNKLKKVGLYKYYLGEGAIMDRGGVARAGKGWNDDDHEKVVTELFADAVEVGMITLPEDYEVEDFEFSYVPDRPHGDELMQIGVKNVARKGIQPQLWTSEAYFLGESNDMNHDSVYHFLRWMCEKIDKLITED